MSEDKKAYRLFLRAYKESARAQSVPDLYLCGFEEYRKRCLIVESGWPPGRPTFEEFWTNSFEELGRLKAALSEGRT